MKQHELRPRKPQNVQLDARETQRVLATVEVQHSVSLDSLVEDGSCRDLFPSSEPHGTTPGFVLDEESNSDELLQSLSLDPAFFALDPKLFLLRYPDTLIQTGCLPLPTDEVSRVNGLPVSNSAGWNSDSLTLAGYPAFPTLISQASSSSHTTAEIIISISKFLYGRPLPITPLTPPPPSHFLNYIQTTYTSTLYAYFYNSLSIGVSVSDVLSHKSPFFNANASLSSDPQLLLAEARKPWIPEHLQPTLSQVLIPHHPYLDLLPFPTLRDRAITLGVSRPDLFDAMDLKRDIFMDGLYCHRGGGRQPWDGRSWEARPWFLEKWKLLIG